MGPAKPQISLHKRADCLVTDCASLGVLKLKEGCTGGSSESTLVKIPHCCKSHVTAHVFILFIGNKKPFTTAKGEDGEEDRHVAEQPLSFG